jgi:hypothetical protein
MSERSRMRALATDGPRRSSVNLQAVLATAHESGAFAPLKPVDLLPVPGPALERPVHVAVLDGAVTDPYGHETQRRVGSKSNFHVTESLLNPEDLAHKRNRARINTIFRRSPTQTHSKVSS